MTTEISEKTGTILVRTETSAYMVDYDRKVIIRTPGNPNDPEIIANDEVYVANLRKDGEEIPFHSIMEPTIGSPLVFLLQVRDDDVITYRRTTYVQEIVEL